MQKKEQEKKIVQGFKIRSFNNWMIFVACIIFLLICFQTEKVLRKYEDLLQCMEDYIACEKDAVLVMEGSDYLTEQVQMFVVLMEPQYADAYFEELHITKRRETGLEDLETYFQNTDTCRELEAALNTSNYLMEREIYAMRLIVEAKEYDVSDFSEEIQAVTLSADDLSLASEVKIEKARSMIFDVGYQDAKALIESHITHFLTDLGTINQKRQERGAAAFSSALNWQRVCISLMFLMNIITFIVITVLIVKPLRIYVKCIKDEKLFEIVGAYEFKYLALTYNNIYEINAANEALLRHKAEHDPLTGIMNRGAFEQLQIILKDGGGPIALLLIDVDRFKQVNDGYGHETGDRVLKKIAELLMINFRSTDYPVRVGGDEFAVIMTDITVKLSDIIENKVNKMNRILQNPIEDLPVTSISVGVAFSEEGYNEELYKKADAALYEVKANGGCGCRFSE